MKTVLMNMDQKLAFSRRFLHVSFSHVDWRSWVSRGLCDSDKALHMQYNWRIEPIRKHCRFFSYIANEFIINQIISQLYPALQSGFIEDDQEHDVSVVALSVQMLTVPPIARSVEGGGVGLTSIPFSFRVVFIRSEGKRACKLKKNYDPFLYECECHELIVSDEQQQKFLVMWVSNSMGTYMNQFSRIFSYFEHSCSEQVNLFHGFPCTRLNDCTR